MRLSPVPGRPVCTGWVPKVGNQPGPQEGQNPPPRSLNSHLLLQRKIPRDRCCLLRKQAPAPRAMGQSLQPPCFPRVEDRGASPGKRIHPPQLGAPHGLPRRRPVPTYPWPTAYQSQQWRPHLHRSSARPPFSAAVTGCRCHPLPQLRRLPHQYFQPLAVGSR